MAKHKRREYGAWACLLTHRGELVLERKRIIHHKANNQHYKQNELMWQAAREEIPI